MKPLEVKTQTIYVLGLTRFCDCKTYSTAPFWKCLVILKETSFLKTPKQWLLLSVESQTRFWVEASQTNFTSTIFWFLMTLKIWSYEIRVQVISRLTSNYLILWVVYWGGVEWNPQHVSVRTHRSALHHIVQQGGSYCKCLETTNYFKIYRIVKRRLENNLSVTTFSSERSLKLVQSV